MTEDQEPVTPKPGEDQEPVTLEPGAGTTPTQAQAAAPVSLSTMAGPVTAVFAIVGAFWFGLLSLAAAIAYEPAGVRPREIGLSSGTVLTQSAVGLAAWIGIFTVILLLQAALFAYWNRSLAARTRRTLARYADIAGATSHIEWFEARQQRRDAQLRRYVLVTTGSAFLLLSTWFVIAEAQRSRDALQDGRRAESTFLSLGAASPWSGEIAKLAWVGGKPAGASALPSCALYLGEAGGTAIIYDASRNLTWRLPSSALSVKTMPELDSCTKLRTVSRRR